MTARMLHFISAAKIIAGCIGPGKKAANPGAIAPYFSSQFDTSPEGSMRIAHLLASKKGCVAHAEDRNSFPFQDVTAWRSPAPAAAPKVLKIVTRWVRREKSDFP